MIHNEASTSANPSIRTAKAMPSRRERLRAFMRLKSQNRLLLGSVGVLTALAMALGTAMIVNDNAPETVRLGKGMASVDAKPLNAYERKPADTAPASAPSASDLGSGEASYYGPGFEGRPTANGERFNPNDLTAAHRTLPMGSRVRVTNPKTGDSVVVRINDRGPFHGNRVIDLSQAAARTIGLIRSGTGTVRLALLVS